MDSEWKWTAALVGGAGVASLGLIYLSYRKYRKQPVSASHQHHAHRDNKSFFLSDPVSVYVLSHNVENEVLGELRALSIKHEKGFMSTSVETGKLLTFYCRALNARKVLDVGVFTGCSALSMALGLPDDGKVIACDINDEYASLGKPFWKKCGVYGKIDLRLQPAAKTLQELLDNGEAESFDLMFIDADKENYCIYYELGIKLLRKGGIIMVDNALWKEKVADFTISDEETVAVRTLNQQMKDDPRVDFCLLNIADGLGIAQKL